MQELSVMAPQARDAEQAHRSGRRGSNTACLGSSESHAPAHSSRPAAASAWSEEELLARMLARESLAWNEFVRRYRRLIDGRIDAVISRFPGLIGNADADDIFALLMYRLQTRDMHRLRTFDVRRGIRLSTWFSALVRNVAWDYVRACTRSISGANGLEVDVADVHARDPECWLEHRQRSALTQASLGALSERDRWFLQLHMDGEAPENISRLLNISLRTVYSKKYKLLTRLRVSLADSSDGNGPTTRRPLPGRPQACL
jgi:RNA polymerase sigma-70 factor, ECF subfamily